MPKKLLKVKPRNQRSQKANKVGKCFFCAPTASANILHVQKSQNHQNGVNFSGKIRRFALKINGFLLWGKFEFFDIWGLGIIVQFTFSMSVTSYHLYHVSLAYMVPLSLAWVFGYVGCGLVFSSNKKTFNRFFDDKSLRIITKTMLYNITLYKYNLAYVVLDCFRTLEEPSKTRLHIWLVM